MGLLFCDREKKLYAVPGNEEKLEEFNLPS